MDQTTENVKMEEEKGAVTRTTVRYLIRLLGSAGIPKLVLAFAVVLSLIGAVTGLIVPLITGQLIDSFSADMLRMETIGVLIAMFLLEAVSSGFSYYMLAYVGNQTVNKIRKRLWNKVLALPVRF